MYIYGKTAIDKNGRILLSDFFSSEELPKKVALAVDVKLRQIVVLESNKRPEFGASIPLDEKNRIIIPKWLREELEPSLNEKKELFFVYDEGKRYLSPKSDNIL